MSNKEEQMIPASAVAALVAAEVKKHLEALSVKRDSNNSDQGFVQSLALQLAELSDQGTGKVHIAPEEIAKRARARTKLEELLDEVRDTGLKPEYQLRGKVHLNETLVSPLWIDNVTHEAKPTEIIYYGVPNEMMIPLNEIAHKIFDLFKESVGGIKVEKQNLRITARGLVVTSGGNSLEGKENARSNAQSTDFEVIGRRGDRKSTHILGTLMAPAKEMF